MEPNETLGQFEQLVLTTVYMLNGQGYTVTICDEVNKMTQPKRVMVGTVHVSLVRMLGKGLLSSHFANPTARRGGKAKRYFQVTAEGERALRHAMATAKLMSDRLDGLKGSLT